jgi:hypothetical protein
MSDTNVFRQFAKEAMRGSAKAANGDEKRALEELACTWTQAALMSERVFGPSPTLSSRDAGAAEPNSHEAA